MLKACKNCPHFYNDCGLPFTLQYGKCRRTKIQTLPKVDPIDGTHVKPDTSYSYASSERSDFGNCGKDGVLFELETDDTKRFVNMHGVQVSCVANLLALVALYDILLTYKSS